MPKVAPLESHVFAIDIVAPRQQVWDEITKTGRVQRAMHNTVLEGAIVPGSKLRYYSPNKKRVFVVGVVVEVEAPAKFSHTFKFTMRPDEPTLVTWELQETELGCRVTLTHSDWTDQVATHKSVVKGWREILSTMKYELETGDIPIRAKIAYRIMGWLSFLLPKSTTVPHVERSGW